MKSDIVLFLKKFIEIWNRKGSIKNLYLNKNCENEFQDYMLYFVNLLDYAQYEDIPENKLAVNEICANDKLWMIYYRNSEQFNWLLKNYSGIEEKIEKNGYFPMLDMLERNRVNPFLDEYKKFVFDNEKNIVCYRFLCASKEMRVKYDNLINAIPVEIYDDSSENKIFRKVLCKKGKNIFKANVDYVRFKDNLFVDNSALQSGGYFQLCELREKQSKVAIVDLKTQKILSQEEINKRFVEKNELFKILRHDVSAHNNMCYYKLSKIDRLYGRIVFSEKRNLALFFDRNVLYNNLRQIDIACNKKVKEYYLLDTSIKTQQIETDKVKDYLNACKLYKLDFDKELDEDLLETFVIDKRDDYLKLSKIEKQEITLVEFIRKNFEKQFSVKIKVEGIKIFTEKLEKIIEKKVVNEEFKTYAEIGTYLMLFIKFFGLNVIKNVNNSNKDYNFKIDFGVMKKLILRMFDFAECKRSKEAKGFFDSEAKDFYMLTALCFITYINFVQNKLIDSIKEEKKPNKLSGNTRLLIEKVEKFDKKNKIFTFSKRNFADERPKNLDEYVFILRTIRNSIVHNNFAINYVSSCDIFDANLYFIDDSLINKYELKIVCSFKNFLEFITNDMFADYVNENDVIVGDSFDEIIKKACEKFNNPKD